VQTFWLSNSVFFALKTKLNHYFHQHINDLNVSEGNLLGIILATLTACSEDGHPMKQAKTALESVQEAANQASQHAQEINEKAESMLDNAKGMVDQAKDMADNHLK